MLLDVDGRVNVVPYDPLVNEDGVLVVVTFPRGEADEDVSSESKLAFVGRRTVSDRVACLDLVANGDDGPLVDAGALVGSLVLGKHVGVYAAVLDGNLDPVSGNEAYDAVVSCDDANAGVLCGTVFHTRTDDRRLRLDERYGLTLHVRTHEGTDSVVVAEERDKAR